MITRQASSDVQCDKSPTGSHQLVWDHAYIEPVLIYGLWEGGGRSRSSVHCSCCEYAAPYYLSVHGPLMNEPYVPKGMRGASGLVEKVEAEQMERVPWDRPMDRRNALHPDNTKCVPKNRLGLPVFFGVDYRKILTAYVSHVGNSEGTEFLSCALQGLSAEENAALYAAAADDPDINEDHRQRLVAKAREFLGDTHDWPRPWSSSKRRIS